MADLSLSERLPSFALKKEERIAMGLPSAVMEKRLREGLVLSSAASKERSRMLPLTEAERREADCGVLEVSAMEILF